MIRGTTADILLTIEGVDVSVATAVYVTISQHGVAVHLTGEDLVINTTQPETNPVSTIEFILSQAQSFKFSVGKANVQVNWLYEVNGKLMRSATYTAEIPVEKQTLNKVIVR